MRPFMLSVIIIAFSLFSISVSAEAKLPCKDENAALRYLLAMGFMPQFSNDDIDHLRNVNSLERFAKIPEKVRDKLSEATSQHTLKLLELAGRCKDCNFMPDQTYKPEDFPPPFRTIKFFSLYLNAGAWKAIKEGNHVTGANIFVSIFRLGDDVENYGPIISCMIGLDIRRYAFESMKTVLAGDFKPEAKKIIIDYLKSLPRPVINVKEGLYLEKKFTESFLKELNTIDGVLKILRKVTGNPSHTPQVSQNEKISLCNANQRVLTGALEIAAMDGIVFFPTDEGFAEIQEKLLKDKVLRGPVECPGKGNYKIEFHPESENIKVSCTCGADPEKPVQSEEKPVAASNYDAELEVKARKYLSSGQYEQDCNKLLEYYDKMLAMDPFQENGLKRIEELQKKYTSKENVLVKLIAIDFKLVFEKQLKLQEEIDNLEK